MFNHFKSRLCISVFCLTVFTTSVFAGESDTHSQELWTAYTAKKARPMNPAISLNVLGLLRRGTDLSNNRSAHERNGLSLQEMELQLSSDIDPYIRATGLLSLHQKEDSTEYEVEPEELYIETISLPWVTLRAGIVRLALGKHNQLHTHAYPFIDAPLTQHEFVGDHGLNENAVSASVLIPTHWFSEFTLQGFDPSNEEVFASQRSGDYGVLGRFRNLWELSEATTLDWGLSGTQAKNSLDRNATLYGTDITLKWRPTEKSRARSVTWTTELIRSHRRGKTDSDTGLSLERLSAVSSWVQYQFSEGWWIQARIEQAGILQRSAGVGIERKRSVLLGYFPTEFSGFRAQYDQIDHAHHLEHRGGIQYNVSMGAHPAHAY